MSRTIRALFTLFVLPMLIGGIVWLIGGRPLTFDLIHRAVAARFPRMHTISTAELARLLATPAAPILLDARTVAEYDVSHLAGARRIDPAHPSLEALGDDVAKSAAIVVYGAVGYRSAVVSDWLTAQGYAGVRHLDGGLFRWANEGRPVFEGTTRVARVHPYDRVWGLLLKSEHRADVPPVKDGAPAP